MSRETTGRMVDVGMEWKRQGWYVLVGDGTGYKMVPLLIYVFATENGVKVV